MLKNPGEILVDVSLYQGLSYCNDQAKKRGLGNLFYFSWVITYP